MADILTYSDLKRIDAIARKSITECFKKKRFRFCSDDIEEAVLMTNEKVARYWNNYDPAQSRSALFYLMAMQAACDYMTARTNWNAHHRSTTMLTDDGTVWEEEFAERESPDRYQADFQVIIDEKVEAVNREIDALGDNAAQALRLNALGYSYAEIQEILGGNANALKTMVSRSRAQLRKNLGYKFAA